ncbi:hypothetical protein AMD27_17450 (plasmid) [Acinetobacter sp. TGL-Y2]|nr:hypothetical protein AMD27_17450 [Acinetobacter sp. TGL-Y2]
MRSATAYKNEYRTIMNAVYRVNESLSLGIAHIGELPIWDIPDKDDFPQLWPSQKKHLLRVLVSFFCI